MPIGYHDFLLYFMSLSGCLFCGISRLDKKRQRKVHKWQEYHSAYIKKFKQTLSKAGKQGWGRTKPHNYLAHDNYVRWLRENSRLFLCQPAFQEDILEEPVDVEALVENAYNKEVREGHRIGLAGQVHFAVCVPCCVFYYHLFAYLFTCCLTFLFVFICSATRYRNMPMKARGFLTLPRREQKEKVHFEVSSR